MSRDDIRITREADQSENMSEEQKNEFELTNNSSVAQSEKKNKRASARLKSSKKPQ